MFLDFLLDSFEANLLGPNQTEKAKKNVKQRISYAKKFLLYMSDGGTDINKSLLFLNNTVKLNGYVALLCPLQVQVMEFISIFAELMTSIFSTISYLNHLRTKLKPSSLKHVLIDIEAFLRFVMASSIPKVRVTGKILGSILERLRGWKKGLGAQVVVQRLEYKRRKSGAFQCRFQRLIL